MAQTSSKALTMNNNLKDYFCRSFNWGCADSQPAHKKKSDAMECGAGQKPLFSGQKIDSLVKNGTDRPAFGDPMSWRLKRGSSAPDRHRFDRI